jgi:N4-gp56 family major capsid protein
MVTERYGQVDPQPKNNTRIRKYRRYESLARASSPLAEGVTPTGKKLSYTDIECTLEQYGDVVILTDVVKDTHEDNVLMSTMDVMGEQAAETVEEVRLNFMRAGTNAFFANNAANRAAVNSPPVRGDLRRIYRSFKRQKARTITQIVKASAKISTEPVGEAYFAIGHTDLDSDIRSISGFVPVENYSDSMNAQPGEIGKIENFRFVLTSMVDPWLQAGTSGTTYLSGGEAVSVAANADVYPLLFIARDSYAIVPLQGMNSVTVMVRNPSPVIGDELAQRGFASWKTYQTGTILNQNWLARLECAATAVPS